MKLISTWAKEVKDFFKSMADWRGWGFVAFGVMLFCARVPMPSTDYINLPYALTILQMAGLMFAIYGLQMVASMVFWPQVRVKELMTEVRKGNTSAGLVLAGLLFFNGVSVIAFVMWVSSSLGAGLSAR